MFYAATKRTIDILASIVLIILFLPVWIVIPILIKLDSPGGVFFLQNRLGLNGVIFKIIKFRTMKENADDYWKSHPKLYKKFKANSWKLTLEEDPRITRMGKILRQTSIDEFPQVFNILKGDMSLIGPRPIRKNEVKDAIARFGKKVEKPIKQSFTVRPGLTGPWQVSGRNDVPWDKRIAIDADYAKKKSLMYDFIIAIKTPTALISKW